MSIDDFIIAIFCLIDDELNITMEIVGEFLGKDCDKAIWEYFKSHWQRFFPKIPDRSNFVRQAANLHVIKRLLQESLAVSLCAFGDTLHMV